VRVTPGDLRRAEVGSDDALGRTRLFDLGDDCGFSSGHFRTQGADEIAARRLRLSFGAHFGERLDG